MANPLNKLLLKLKLPDPKELMSRFGSVYSWLFLLPSAVLVQLSGKKRPRIRGRQLDGACHLLCAKAGESPLGGEGSNPEAIRKMLADNAVDLGVKPGRPVETENVSLKTSDGESIRIRRYVPTEWDGKTSMLYIHGGGWVLCDLDTHDSICAYMADYLGIQLFSVEYRLAPENPFPVPLQDCLEAWDWMMESQGCSPQTTVVAGDSAGANLATAMCLYLRDNSDQIPAMQLLIYPALDPTMSTATHKDFGKGFYLTADAMRWFWSSYLPDQESKEDPLAAPLGANVKNLPKTQVVVAGCDPLADEGKLYARKLRSAGVECSFQEYPSLMHGFINFMVVPAARQAVNHFLNKTKPLLPSV